MRRVVAKRIRKAIIESLILHLSEKFPDKTFPLERIRSAKDLNCITDDEKEQKEIFVKFKNNYRNYKKYWKKFACNEKHLFYRLCA